MNKRISFYLMVLLILCCCACGANETSAQISLNDSITIDDYADIKLEYIFFSDTLYSPNRNSIYQYYENQNSSMEFVDFIFSFKNISNSNIDIDSSILLSIEGDGNRYEPYATLLEGNYGQDLDSYGQIIPLQTTKIHCTALIPKELNTFSAKFSINNKSYLMNVDKENINMDIKDLKVGEKLEAADFATISITDIGYRNKIEPSNTSGFYSYYEPENQNDSFLVIEIDAKNIGKNEIDIDQVCSGVAIYDGLYEYVSMVIAEDKDYTISNYVDIKPLDTKKIYLCFEIPNETKEMNGKIKFYFGEKYYFINILK